MKFQHFRCHRCSHWCGLFCCNSQVIGFSNARASNATLVSAPNFRFNWLDRFSYCILWYSTTSLASTWASLKIYAHLPVSISRSDELYPFFFFYWADLKFNTVFSLLLLNCKLLSCLLPKGKKCHPMNNPSLFTSNFFFLIKLNLLNYLWNWLFSTKFWLKTLFLWPSSFLYFRS